MLNKTISLILASCTLAGCTIPGATLPTSNKNQVWNADDSDTLSPRVNVYPLTPNLINELKLHQIAPTSQVNLGLEDELSDYQYHIGTGDVLNVTIWDHPELTIPAGSYRSSEEAGNWVHADGTIFYPYIGKIAVKGLTVTEVRDLITQRIKKYVEDPQVDVNIAAFRSQKSYVTGEVNKPGAQAISNIPLTLLDAINAAGGITQDADWRNITLTHHDGKEEHLSLYALIQKGDLTQNRLLHKGDIIHVPRNDAQKIFIMGEVATPQVVKIDRAGMSLTEALANAGGINEKSADATGVFVIRSTGLSHNDGKADEPLADVYQLNMQDATSLVMGTEFQLQPYDVIYVTAAPVARWNRLITNLVPTISGFSDLTDGMIDVKTLKNLYLGN